MVKIVFFGLEDWEEDFLAKELSGHNVVFVSEPLSLKNVSKASDAVVVGVFVYSDVPSSVIKHLKCAKLITTMSTGFDHIDLRACKKQGITVCNVPTYGENTVAEHAMALLLAISRKIVDSVDNTRRGNFSLDGLRGFDLFGKTIGVVGTGNIGRHLACYANAFGMRVLAFDKFPNSSIAKKCNIKYVSFNELLKRSDVISLHVPLNKDTKHLINKSAVKKMKKGVILINTARGGIVDTSALLFGLRSGIIGGAGLDVLEGECVIKEEKELLTSSFQKKCDLKVVLAQHLLRDMSNVLITPHNAFNSAEAIERILVTTSSNIVSFLKNKPVNVVKL